VQRTGDDVPGWLIPQLYHQYVQSGDARQMRGVIYHNLIDILSMVTLAATLCDTFSRADATALPHQDLLSLARWYEQLNMIEQAETTYQAALHNARHIYDQKFCLEALAAMFKRLDRDDEAASLWRAWADLAPNEVTPRLELAKYHEWTTHDFDQAMHWTDSAEQANNTRARNWEQQGVHAEIIKRRARLVQKLGRKRS
jgi:tetratricopeptide (TPR) repeat protein